MTATLKAKRMPKYEDGEKSCEFCSAPLPAHQHCPGDPVRTCGASGCVDLTRTVSWGRYVEEGELQCQVVNCTKMVPEGRYRRENTLLCCSRECWWHLSKNGTAVHVCGCNCGTLFHRRLQPWQEGKPVYYDRKHWAKVRIEENAERDFAPFKDLYNEYTSTREALGMGSLSFYRIGLRPFLIFLTEIGITNLESVRPTTITKYLAWAKENGRRSAHDQIFTVKAFFEWLIATEMRQAINPVRKMHVPKKPHRDPRPLSDSELELLWEILDREGGTRLCLAAAIGEEGGCRASEVCNIRLEDIDLAAKTIKVRLPTKGKRPRVTYFRERTTRYLTRWLLERREDCGHDHLLYNEWGNPWQYQALRNAYLKVVSTSARSERGLGVGFDKWSTHCLRHTFATNMRRGGADPLTIMATGGWGDLPAAKLYIKEDEEDLGRNYFAAHERLEALKADGVKKTTRTLAQRLADRRAEESALVSRKVIVATQKDCV